MNVAEIKEPRIDVHTNDNIIKIINKTLSFNSRIAEKLKENQAMILSINNSYMSKISILQEELVLTHGDLDQLNVIWDKTHNPFLIDWESVKKMNRTRDIVRTSLNWSGLGQKNFSLFTYLQMLYAYKKLGGNLNKEHVEAALYSIFGNMINWIIYNIELLSLKQTKTSQEVEILEIDWTLTSMKSLKAKFNVLMNKTIESANSKKY